MADLKRRSAIFVDCWIILLYQNRRNFKYSFSLESNRYGHKKTVRISRTAYQFKTRRIISTSFDLILST